MNVYQTSSGYRYEQDDWRVDISQGQSGTAFEVVSLSTGGMTFESGTNLDRLVSLITAAKADAISKGVNWSGN